MPVWRACLIMAVSGTVASAAPLSLQLSTALDWNTGIVQRCELREGDFRIALAGSLALSPAEPAPSILVGLSSPWVRAGPLSPAGSLREACNPLGFFAGSDVFTQRTGFVLDESFPAPRSGILLMPVARSLGVFYRSLEGGGDWIGCMASVLNRPGMSTEGFVSVSDPPPQSAGEDWTRSCAPFAGGRILSAGAKLLVETGQFGVGATSGTSRGEMSPPGCFCNLYAGARTGILKLSVLMGWADPEYVTPSGEHSAQARTSSAALVLSDPRGSIDLRLSRLVDQVPFSAGPCIASRTEVSFKVERTQPAAGETLLLARVEGGTIARLDVDGERDPASRCSALIGARVSPLRLEAGASLSDADGLSPCVTAEALLDHCGSRAGFEGRLAGIGGPASALTALLSLRLEGPEHSIAFGAGFADMKLSAPLGDLARRIRLSFEWRSREISE